MGGIRLEPGVARLHEVLQPGVIDCGVDALWTADAGDVNLAPEALQDDAALRFRGCIRAGWPSSPAGRSSSYRRSWPPVLPPPRTCVLSSLAPCCGLTHCSLGVRTSPLLSVRNCLHKMSLSLTPNRVIGLYTKCHIIYLTWPGLWTRYGGSGARRCAGIVRNSDRDTNRSGLLRLGDCASGSASLSVFLRRRLVLSWAR